MLHRKPDRSQTKKRQKTTKLKPRLLQTRKASTTAVNITAFDYHSVDSEEEVVKPKRTQHPYYDFAWPAVPDRLKLSKPALPCQDDDPTVRRQRKILARLQDPQLRKQMHPKVVSKYKSLENQVSNAYNPLFLPKDHPRRQRTEALFEQDFNDIPTELQTFSTFPNGNTVPNPYTYKHLIKPGHNEPCVAEYQVIPQVDPSYFSWSKPRLPFRGKDIEFVMPGPGPLASQQDKLDWRDDLIEIQFFFRLWDPRYVSPDPSTMEVERNYPMIYAFNHIPALGQLRHPDYKKFVLWFYWPEYVKNREMVGKNMRSWERNKPFEYMIGAPISLAINVCFKVFTVVSGLFERIPNMMTPGRPSISIRRTMKAVKKELQHFGHGFKHLIHNATLSFGILKKKFEESRTGSFQRSDRRLIVRTVFDMLRLVPLIIILVIPFLEFALPLLLKLFPNMLPSTFLDKDQEKTKAFNEYKLRLQLARYLEQTTVRTIIRQIQSQSGLIQDTTMDPAIRDRFQQLVRQQRHHHQSSRKKTILPQTQIQDGSETTADESTTEMSQRPMTEDVDQLTPTLYGHDTAPIATLLYELFQRLGRGESVESREVQPLLYLFNKTITLDTLRHPQLESLCRFINIPTAGDHNNLRDNIVRHFQVLHEDDLAIRSEGVNALSISELHDALKARGMRYNGVKKRQLRASLENWLLLHLDLKISPPLLILSRACMLLEELQNDPRFKKRAQEHLKQRPSEQHAAEPQQQQPQNQKRQKILTSFELKRNINHSESTDEEALLETDSSDDAKPVTQTQPPPTAFKTPKFQSEQELTSPELEAKAANLLTKAAEMESTFFTDLAHDNRTHKITTPIITKEMLPGQEDFTFMAEKQQLQHHKTAQPQQTTKSKSATTPPLHALDPFISSSDLAAALSTAKPARADQPQPQPQPAQTILSTEITPEDLAATYQAALSGSLATHSVDDIPTHSIETFNPMTHQPPFADQESDFDHNSDLSPEQMIELKQHLQHNQDIELRPVYSEDQVSSSESVHEEPSLLDNPVKESGTDTSTSSSSTEDESEQVDYAPAQSDYVLTEDASEHGDHVDHDAPAQSAHVQSAEGENAVTGHHQDESSKK